MPSDKNQSKIVIINHAVNYLTIDMCNAFSERFDKVVLMTGSIHEQGTSLNDSIEVEYINRYIRTPTRKKFWSYIRATLQIFFLLVTKYRKYEVFCISLPPTAYLLKIVLPHKFSMLIWDVYPDLLKITGMKESHPLYSTWSLLNKMAFRRAHKVFTIGNRIAELIANYVDREKVEIIPLWSVFEENERVPKEENIFLKEHGIEDKFIVQYSGNIGLTHNVEALVRLAIVMKDHDHILFQIIGKGERVPFLKNLAKEKKLTNCQLLPFQSDEMFPYSLSAADLGVVILDKKTSKGSVPSKSYNLMSYGIPSLYIAEKDSELYEYCQAYNHGGCFTENELDDAAEFVLKLSRDEGLHKKYSENSEKAGQNYKSRNAHKLVEMYLSE